MFTFSHILDYVFDGCPIRDFGVFGKQILGIQRTSTYKTIPFKNEITCDFYFDKKEVNEYVELFDNIWDYICN